MERVSNGEVETESKISKNKQAKVIAKLKSVLKFLETVQIENQDSIDIVDKSVDELLSSLKYLPSEPHFSILPTEIKTDILSYLCDNGVFVAASVCEEWKHILESRLLKFNEVSLGQRCSCEDGVCLRPEEVLKALVVLKMDITLAIRRPITEVDINVLIRGFQSVSKMTIDGRDVVGQILTKNQIRHLFEGLDKDFKEINILNLDLTHLDQDRLMNVLLKTSTLKLHESYTRKILDVETLIVKFLQVTENWRLKCLFLGYLDFPVNLFGAMASALCNVQSVKLYNDFTLNVAMIKQLMKNILTQDIDMKELRIRRMYDWRQLVSPEDLKIVISKMKGLYMMGQFTLEQIRAARSLPGVDTKPYQRGVLFIILKY